MKTAARNKLAVLMALHTLWGFVLWFSISKYGLGVSTDAVHLLFGGLNLSEGRGLISHDGSFLIAWPPLYPAMLGLIHVVTGLGIFAAAGVLQAAAFVGLSLCLSILFLQMFPDDFLLALAASVLSDVGAVVLIGFDEVGSDYVHLFLVVLFVLLAGTYVQTKSPRAFVVLAAVGMLATLERYIGIAALATGVAAVVILVGGGAGQRLMRGIILSAAGVPAGIWLFITSRLYQPRAPISFSENFTWFSKSILEWFYPVKAVRTHLGVHVVLLWVGIGVALIVAGIAWSRLNARNAARARTFMLLVFLFGAFYVLALFGSASLAYFNKLGGRFLLPLYFPMVTLVVVAVGLVSQSSRSRSGAVRLAASMVSGAALLAVGVLLLRVTFPIAIQSHANGAVGGENAFNTAMWHENGALQYWISHPPQGEYLLFSNQPDGVAFHTQHATGGSPRRTSGPYATDIYPLSDYIPGLFASGLDVYMVWIEPGSARYFYTRDELASIARMQPLFVSDDGGVYRLLPGPGS